MQHIYTITFKEIKDQNNPELYFLSGTNKHNLKDCHVLAMEPFRGANDEAVFMLKAHYDREILNILLDEIGITNLKSEIISEGYWNDNNREYIYKINFETDR